MRPPWRDGHLRNATSVALGLGAVGFGSAAALALAARFLSTGDFAVFATWWTVANIFGLAFAVVEGYLPKVVLDAAVHDRDDRQALAFFSRGTALVLAAMGGLLAVGAGRIANALFDGDRLLVALIFVYTAASACQSLQRGAAIGHSRFSVFPIQMGADGTLRLLGAATVGWAYGTVRGFALALCVAAWIGVIAGSQAERRWWGWGGRLRRAPLGPLGLLTVASLGTLVMNNAAVPWLVWRGSVSPLIVGAVAGAVTLSRVPTLLVGAAYGPLLSPLARAVVASDRQTFRRVHRRASLTALAGAAAFAVMFALLGGPLLRIYLGPAFGLDPWLLSAMAAGSGLMFVCVVEQAALAALSVWGWVTSGWLTGGLVYLSFLLLPVDDLVRVGAAALSGPLAAALVMAAGRMSAERRQFVPAPLAGAGER